MSTSTIINLVRWRVRDLAACFHACKIPRIDEEPSCTTSTDDHHVPRKTTLVFDPIGEHRINRRQRNGQKLKRKKSNIHDQEKASCTESTNSQQIITNSKKSDQDHEMAAESSRSRSCFKQGEEYIVFCFKDDGTIHLVKEKRPSGASTTATCGESSVEKATRWSFVDVGDMDDEEITAAEGASTSLSSGKVEGEGSNDDVQVAWPPDHEIKEINHIENHEAKTLSSMLSVAESSESNRSDASSGSFAFPVLRWEWMGSPVHMPRPEDMGLRSTQKASGGGVRLHCCRF